MLFGDIEAGMRLKTAAGWNQTEEDWRLFLVLNPVGCFVTVHRGKVIGTVTTIKYGQRLGWIGMLLVDAAHRRRGVGTSLLQRAIESLSGCQAIGLDATPAGEALYRRLGFEGECRLQRMMVRRLPYPPVSATRGRVNQDGDLCVCSLNGAALERAVALDRRVFGADRALLLRSLIGRDPPGGWHCNRYGLMRGFCVARRGATCIQLGPLIAETVDDAIEVCTPSFGTLAEEAVVLDVPSTQERFLQWLLERGFAEQRSFTRMFLGSGRASGTLAQQFAISGPELG
jgi:GNAT superfamily N-acetyltransferase